MPRIAEPTKEVLSALEKVGFSSFRPGQQEAVMRILCGEFLAIYKKESEKSFLLTVDCCEKIIWMPFRGRPYCLLEFSHKR